MPESTPTIFVDLVHTPCPESPHKGHGIDPARWQPWHIIVKSADNHEALFRSTERYFNRSDAVHAVWLAFGAESNVYLREAETGNVELRLASGG